MLHALTERKEWKFFGVLPKADPALAAAWWIVLLLRGVLPAVFAIAMGVLVGAVQRGDALAGPLALAGVVFVLLQVLTPDPSGGQRQPRRPHRRLALRPADRGLRAPAGHGPPRGSDAHQRPHRRARLRPRHDRPAAVDLDGLHRRRPGRDDRRPRVAPSSSPATRGGRRSCSRGAWLATHWLLRESAIWRDRNTDEVRAAQRDADYAYRLAVDPPASKELRLFGLAGWTIDRFVARRTRLHELQYAATRLRERPVLWSLLLVVAANVVVFWSLASAAADGRLSLGEVVVVRAERRRHVDDRVRRPQLGARRRGGAGRRGAAARAGDGARPARCRPAAAPADGMPAREIRFRDVTFAYPGRRRPVLDALRSRRFPPARRSPSSARTAPARRRSPSCCAGSTTRSPARSRSTASTCASSTSTSWRARVTAVFQDFIRFELPLRDNVAPAGAPDDVVRAALEAAGAANLAGARHGPGPRLRRRHRPLRRPVAARRARARAVRGAARRRRRAARRADRAARRARRSGDLRPHPRRDAALHDDPDLAPLLHRAPGRSHLRARARPRHRARHARRADGARRPLSHDVRPAGAALQRRRGRGGDDL